MSARVVYRLVGYDKQTEKLAVALDVPRNNVARAKSIAGIAVEGDAPPGDWELTRSQSREIARLINAGLDIDRYDCFLEPYAPRDEAARN